MQSPLLLFRSSLWSIEDREDDSTNPRIYGRQFAFWLAGQLNKSGIRTERVFPEDFGWLVEVPTSRWSIYVACSNVEGSTDRWQVFAMCERPFWAKLLGSNREAVELSMVFDHVLRVLGAESGITDLEQEEV